MKKGELYEHLANLRRAPGGGLAQLWDVLATISDNESVWYNISGPLLGLLTVDGDIIRRAGGFVVRLPIGAAGEVLTVVGGLPAWAAGGGGGFTQGCRAYHNVVQNVPSGAYTALAMNSERFDTDAMHDLVLNNSRITFNTAGRYLIGAGCHFAFSAGGIQRQLGIRIDGVTLIVLVQIQNAVAVSVAAIANTIYDLAAGQYAEAVVYQDSGGGLNINSAGNWTPEFWAHRMS